MDCEYDQIAKKRNKDILQGILTFPQQLRELLEQCEEYHEESVNNFWEDVWHCFLNEKKVNTAKWIDQFSEEVWATMIYNLCKSDWITSEIINNYGTISLKKEKILRWITADELLEIRRKYKLNKYKLKVSESIYTDAVKLNGRITKTGLERDGFKEAGNVKFCYDTYYFHAYEEGILHNLLNNHELERDKAALNGEAWDVKDCSYEDAVYEVLADYLTSNKERFSKWFTLGNNICDSRGRAIFKATSKIFNPIGNKDARALMVLQNQEPLKDVNSVYKAIASLAGIKGTEEQVIACGRQVYITRGLPEYSEMLETKNFKELHTLIWLERLYDNLDVYFKDPNARWIVPISLDAKSSMLQYVGVLTNNHEYIRKTGLTGWTTEDIWTVEGLTRQQVKFAMTPTLYGGTQPSSVYWDKKKVEWKTEDILTMHKACTEGIFKQAKEFSDLLVGHSSMQERMKVNVYGEEFWIECNKKVFGYADVTQHRTYTTNLRLQSLPKYSYKADLESFKRYNTTCLIHHLDSRVADFVCDSVINCRNISVIPNHDAFYFHPNYAEAIKKQYMGVIKLIYKQRIPILQQFMTSINIPREKIDAFIDKMPKEEIELKSTGNFLE